MAGSLTLGGLAAGMPGGQILFGPSTISGTKSEPELINVELESGVEKKVALPAEAKQWAAIFPFAGTEPPEVTIKWGASSMSIPAGGFACNPLPTGTKELGFKAATAPKTFQLAVI